MLRIIAVLAAVAVCGGPLSGAGTSVLFDPSSPTIGPFPTDVLTVADPTQKTGLRMNLPLPDCQAEPDTCSELGFINELDGFNIDTRIRVRFSGEIDVTTLAGGIFFVFLSGTPGDEYYPDRMLNITPINQVLYDPETHTAYAKPDELLHQHSRYVLVVTSAIRDVEGDPVVVDPAYPTYLGQPATQSWELGRTVRTVAHLFQPHEIVAASRFTTVSATRWLEQARNALENTVASVQMTGQRSVFDLSEVASITCQFETKVGS
ncbi:MAG: hypothetical protein GY953_18710, partial [bacterium]|nr:hypothetical protein [bacterium]